MILISAVWLFSFLKSVAGETLSICDKAEPACSPLGRSVFIIYFECRLGDMESCECLILNSWVQVVPVIIKMAFYSAVNMHKDL
jgi:hypothetical protein